MITENGYSKDVSIMPEGIVITFGYDLIEYKGGLRSFIRHFLLSMHDENCTWLQKCKNAPKNDILYVYIIIAGRLRYRCYYGGYQSGQTSIYNSDARSWSTSTVIIWPRIVLAGPVEKCPFKRQLKGFQGFRYCTKLF